jgi:SAM-dependent methyltransferase
VTYRYLLGDSRREAARLRFQARLWDPVAHALFDRLGVRRGWRVLEVGPGPGSLHLELRRRVRGPVDAVERSAPFVERLEKLVARDGHGAGRIWNGDLLHARLPRSHYDLVFTRWVFLFLPDPLAHVKRLVRSLRPGGRIAIQDYHRETWALIPRPPEWWDFLAADREFFASQGGDVNIGGRLPELYRQAGLQVTDVVPTVKSGHPGSAAWKWLFTYYLSIADRYARVRPFTRRKAVALKRWWAAAGRDPSSLAIGPALLDVVGRKPR